MSGYYGPQQVRFSNGQIARNMPVTVVSPGTATPVVLLKDPEKPEPLTGPLFTDSNGFVFFYAKDTGRADLMFGRVRIPVLVLPWITPGAGQEPVSFEFTQNVMSTAWFIEHNLGFNPGGVRVVTDDGRRMFPRVTTVEDGKSLFAYFSRSIRGIAYLS